MSYRRDFRNSKSALFDDGIEEGGLRATSSLSHNISELDNDKAVNSLQDRVIFLKRLTGDIHEEVDSHNRLLDRMGNSMDMSRGIMSGTMDRFKKVFEKKSSRRTCVLVGVFVLSFLAIYYLISEFRLSTSLAAAQDPQIRKSMNGVVRKSSFNKLHFGDGNCVTYGVQSGVL